MWIYHMAKFTYSFGIILLGLALGYGIQVLYRRRIISLPIAIDDLRKLLQKTALLFVNPVAIMGAIWVVNIQDIKIATLPFIGLFALLLGEFWRWVLPESSNFHPIRQGPCTVVVPLRTSAPSGP